MMKPIPYLPTPSLALAGGLAGLSATLCLLLATSVTAEVVDGNKGELVERDPSFLGPPAIEGVVERVEPLDNGDVQPPPLPEELRCAVPPPPTAINPAFDTALYQQLRDTKGNVFFSPYSISEAMGMVFVGAADNTAKEISEALHFGKQETFGDRMQYLRHHVVSNANQHGGKLNLANALCITGSAPDEAYQKQIRQRFEAEVFSGDLDEINDWVKQKTEGHIEKILEKLNPNTACVLLNAVYFKGDWEHPFKARHTRKGKFHVAPEEAVDAKLMHRRGSYQVARGEGWVAVELPYKSAASMVLILPDKAEGMRDLEAKLSPAMLGEVRNKLLRARAKPETIQLVLPKFKIATGYDLIPAFKQLGMRDAFDLKRVNFTKMYADNSVFISQIVHKATLEVDEMGSVASAATAVELSKRGAPRPVPEIRFDRPFLTLIQERETGSILFLGRISDPTAK